MVLLVPLAGPIFVNAQAGVLVAGLILLAVADAAQGHWNRVAVWSVLASFI